VRRSQIRRLFDGLHDADLVIRRLEYQQRPPRIDREPRLMRRQPGLERSQADDAIRVDRQFDDARAARSTGAITEGCSSREMRMLSHARPATQLLASVAPLVKITSAGCAPTSRATFSRASSTMRRATRPSA